MSEHTEAVANIAEIQPKRELPKPDISKDNLIRLEKADELALAVRDSKVMQAAVGLTDTLQMSSAIEQMYALLTDEIMQRYIVPLADKRLGFLTDRAPGSPGRQKAGAYTLPQLRDVVVEAMMHGARLVNNEVNVISGGCYLTKNYFERRLREEPGLTDLKWNFKIGAPKDRGSKDYVPVNCTASWRYHGEPDDLETEFIVRFNRGMTPDAVIGKAKRKLWAAIIERIEIGGVSLPEGEIEGLEGFEERGDFERLSGELDVDDVMPVEEDDEEVIDGEIVGSTDEGFLTPEAADIIRKRAKELGLKVQEIKEAMAYAAKKEKVDVPESWDKIPVDFAEPLADAIERWAKMKEKTEKDDN